MADMDLRVWRRFFTFMALAILIGAFGCGEDEEDDAASDDLAGKTWKTACTRLLTDAQVNAECGSLDEDSCETKYQQYYYISNAVFTAKADVSDTAEYAQLQNTITTYYNADADTAATCATDDTVASYRYVKNYQLNVEPLLTTDEVSTDNGFPTNTASINLQALNFYRTYHTNAVVAAVNDYSICDIDSWATDSEEEITGRENCSASLFGITDRITESRVTLHNPLYDVDGNWTSPFVAGTEEYSIYVIDSDEDPDQLQLGQTPVDSDGSWTDTDYKNAAAIDGSSDAARHTQLGVAYILQ